MPVSGALTDGFAGAAGAAAAGDAAAAAPPAGSGAGPRPDLDGAIAIAAGRSTADGARSTIVVPPAATSSSRQLAALEHRGQAVDQREQRGVRRGQRGHRRGVSGAPLPPLSALGASAAPGRRAIGATRRRSVAAPRPRAARPDGHRVRSRAPATPRSVIGSSSGLIGRRAHPSHRRNTSAVFWPPNPNELDIAASTVARRRDVRREVEAHALGVGVVEVDRRRDAALADRLDRRDRLDRAGRAERVARASTCWRSPPPSARGRRRSSGATAARPCRPRASTSRGRSRGRSRRAPCPPSPARGGPPAPRRCRPAPAA